MRRFHGLELRGSPYARDGRALGPRRHVAKPRVAAAPAGADALGVAGALLSSRALATLLFGVSAVDAVTLLAVVDMLIGVSVIACGIPASRYFFPAASAFAFDV